MVWWAVSFSNPRPKMATSKASIAAGSMGAPPASPPSFLSSLRSREVRQLVVDGGHRGAGLDAGDDLVGQGRSSLAPGGAVAAHRHHALEPLAPLAARHRGANPVQGRIRRRPRRSQLLAPLGAAPAPGPGAVAEAVEFPQLLLQPGQLGADGVVRGLPAEPRDRVLQLGERVVFQVSGLGAGQQVGQLRVHPGQAGLRPTAPPSRPRPASIQTWRPADRAAASERSPGIG
jgi:hypothetical protein